MTTEHEQFAVWLGSILRNIREEKELTRETVSQHIGKTPRHLAAIELGQRCPSIDMLYDLIRYYEISADRVFFPEMSDESPELNRIVRLASSCSQDQQTFIADFIELLKHQRFQND